MVQLKGDERYSVFGCYIWFSYNQIRGDGV
jgi:hypothetical protein